MTAIGLRWGLKYYLNHGFCRIDFVVVSSLAQSGLDNVTVVIVEDEIVFEDVGSSLGGEDIVNHQGAIPGIGTGLVTKSSQFKRGLGTVSSDKR